MHRNSTEPHTGKDNMKTFPFAGQNHRVGQNSRFTRTAMARAYGTVSYLQKRWQAKQGKTTRDAVPQNLLMPTSTHLEQHTSLRQQALSEAQRGNHATAIALFSHLIEQNPDNANDYSNRGLVYFQSGQSEAALTDYNQAIALNPRLDNAYNNRANYYAAQGQFLEAILDYDVALDLNPTNVRAWINQGITFRELEMYDRALESLDLALCLGKLAGHIYAERGRTYHLRGDWNCAVADYHRALAELPQIDAISLSPAMRLRLQVENWLNELISPLQG